MCITANNSPETCYNTVTGTAQKINLHFSAACTSLYIVWAKHINPKKENARKHTDFLSGPGVREEERHWGGEWEKEEGNSPFNCAPAVLTPWFSGVKKSVVSKKHRISKAIIPSLIKEGMVFNTPYFILKIKKNNTNVEVPSTYAFIISSKVSKKAVERNKWKRRGNAILHELRAHIKNGFMFAFILKKECAGLSYSRYKEEIIRALIKSNVI